MRVRRHVSQTPHISIIIYINLNTHQSKRTSVWTLINLNIHHSEHRIQINQKTRQSGYSQSKQRSGRIYTELITITIYVYQNACQWEYMSNHISQKTLIITRLSEHTSIITRVRTHVSQKTYQLQYISSEYRQNTHF